MRNFKSILSGSVFLIVFLSCLGKVNKPCTYIIPGANNKSVYVHKWNWGVNGNNQYVAISPVKLQSNEQIDPKRDYLYEGAFPIFLKLEKDSILIFTYKVVDNPTNPISNQYYIKQIEIDNTMNMMLKKDSLVVNIEKICSE